MGVLAGKVVLITGSGTGLGRAAAISFAREGAQVVLCGRRLEKLEEVSRVIAAEGGNALAVSADVTNESHVKKLISTTIDTFGAIDILVNNAAVFEANPAIDTPLQAWHEQLATNLTGAFLLIREALPHMRNQHSGQIINITSTMAANGAGGYAAYGASKAGLESLTRTVADEEAGYGIGASLFNPGQIKSGMHATGKDPFDVIPQLIKLASRNHSAAV